MSLSNLQYNTLLEKMEYLSISLLIIWINRMFILLYGLKIAQLWWSLFIFSRVYINLANFVTEPYIRSNMIKAISQVFYFLYSNHLLANPFSWFRIFCCFLSIYNCRLNYYIIYRIMVIFRWMEVVEEDVVIWAQIF